MLRLFVFRLIDSCYRRQFEELAAKGEKVGEASPALQAQLAALQAQVDDTSCGLEEEGQSQLELPAAPDSTATTTGVASTSSPRS